MNFVHEVKIGEPRLVKVPEEVGKIRFYTGKLKVLHLDVPMPYRDTPDGVHSLRCRIARRRGAKPPAHPFRKPIPMREEWWVPVVEGGEKRTVKVPVSQVRHSAEVLRRLEREITRDFACSDKYKQGYSLHIHFGK